MVVKKILAYLTAGVLAAGALQAAERIVIKGSDTLGAKFVPQLKEQFKSELADMGIEVTFEIAAEGSSSGVAAIIDGTADIGMSSRDLTPAEVSKAKANGVDVKEVTVAKDGIAVIVNARNPIDDMDVRDVESIFTGDVNNWSAVGGRSGEISVYTRNTASGTYKVFQELAMSERDYGTGSQKMAGNEQIAAEVASNPNGIGYVGLAYIDTPGVKVISINGHKPTVKEINSGSYPYARPLFYLINSNEQMSKVANLFVGFSLSPKGQEIVNQVHFVPLY